MKPSTLRQILLITDGCSNQGPDPAAMAALAREQGITVNVIGVVENDSIDEQGMQEIEAIAAAGGGVSQVVYSQSLSQTVQMVTRKAMTTTIQGVVNNELKQILGRDVTIEDLPPEKRGEVIEVVDELSEVSALEVLILVDTSASMKHKLPTVKESLIDLSISLNARMGENRFSVFLFPGKKNDVEKMLDWTPKLDSLTKVFTKLTPRGITPTGPALSEALQYFGKKRSLRRLLANDEESFYEDSM
ncbi:vWA domain-containing protein [Bacillus testis]|uniref:vWA domain-containing protein n=1 Tax=Bacillus testis TaxID=1622072 RepID=UPI00067EAC44|nr:VWA domain-containing protein [Bacillus testis]